MNNKALVVLMALVLLAIVVFVGLQQQLKQNDITPNTPSYTTPYPYHSNEEIRISYNPTRLESVTDNYVSDRVFKPYSGAIFLWVTIKVENDGYYSFDASEHMFEIRADGILYSVADVTWNAGDWILGSVYVSDGESYTGSLIFQIDKTASSISLEYAPLNADLRSNYNIAINKVSTLIG